MYFNGTKCSSLVLCSLLSLSLYAKEEQQAAQTPGLHKPVVFVENKGQLTDQHNKVRNDVQYSLYTPGMSLLIGNGQMHYQFKKAEQLPQMQARVSTYRMDVTLVGANKYAKVVADDKQDYYENYFTTQAGDEAVTAHSWNKITYVDVYPNIDWVLYVNGNAVEYDFNVRPGGNVNDIKLQYGGATALRMAKDGSIVAETPMGQVTEKKPFAFDGSGKEVASAFKLNGNVVSFKTDAYTGPLTIDPFLTWSTFFGGNQTDVATSVVIDAGHNTYVCGYTASSGLATGGSYHSTYQGGTYDAFLAKYNTAGVIQFVTYYGGTASDQGMSVAVDASGVYIAGVTSSTTGIASGFGAYHGALGGGNDGFIAKLTTAGNFRIWGTYYGGTGNDAVNGLKCDGTNVYVTGQTTSATAVASAGAYQTALSGANDAFVAKFSATSGANTWSTYYGGTGQDNGMAIAYDVSGDIFITGQTNSLGVMATGGAYQTSLSGTNDAFIAMFSPTGTRTWGTYYGGPGTEQGNGIAFDGVTGNIAIVGSTTSSSGIASAKAFQGTYAGSQDAFVTYFSTAGAQLWGSYYGGSSFDYGQAVCFDNYGNVMIAGGTFSTSGIATKNSTQGAIGGDYDAYLAKIDPMGRTLWNTYFGGTFYDYANGVACDANGQMVLAGYTTSLGLYGSGGIATSGAAQTINGGGTYDAFVAKFKIDTFVIINQPYTDTLVCAGGTLNVSYSVYAPGATFQPGNTFTVQLSDITGSFAFPTNIGSAVANGSGTIACVIPPATTPGTGYRIRIVGNNPVFVSPDNYKDLTVVASITDATANSNSPVCVGGDIDLFDNPPYSVTSWSWSGPVAFSSGLQNPVITGVTLANAGVYTVTTTHNGCPPTSATVNVVVNDVTPPTPTDSAGTPCAGSTLYLFADPNGISGVTYHWTGPAGFTSTDQNPAIPSASTANSGTYTVQDSLGGCPSVAATITVTVLPVLPVSVSITASAPYVQGAPGDTICAGTMVSFTSYTVNGGSSPTYQWYTGPASPVIGAISSTWASSTLTDGSKVFCEVASNALCPSPAVATSNVIDMNVIDHAPIIYVAASPGRYVSPGGTITFTSSVYDAGISPLYQWSKNGVNVPGATGPTYTLTGVNRIDTISLKVTSTMACSNPDSAVTTIIVGTNVGVANITASLNDVGLFPNPNNGNFTLKGTIANLDNNNVTIEITNLLGQVVYTDQATVQNNELNKSVELNNVASGVYLLRLSQDGSSKIFRFTVQR